MVSQILSFPDTSANANRGRENQVTSGLAKPGHSALRHCLWLSRLSAAEGAPSRPQYSATLELELLSHVSCTWSMYFFCNHRDKPSLFRYQSATTRQGDTPIVTRSLSFTAQLPSSLQKHVNGTWALDNQNPMIGVPGTKWQCTRHPPLPRRFSREARLTRHNQGWFHPPRPLLRPSKLPQTHTVAAAIQEST